LDVEDELEELMALVDTTDTTDTNTDTTDTNTDTMDMVVEFPSIDTENTESDERVLLAI
jgi:hypothetical protein